jgi:hypothetical protein
VPALKGQRTKDLGIKGFRDSGIREFKIEKLIYAINS